MNRMQRIALISPLVAALLGGAVFGFVRAGSSVVGCGEETVAGVAGLDSPVADGRGTPAIAGDKILMLDPLGNRTVYLPDGGRNGVLRHVASAPGAGTAYVIDNKGPDTLVSVSPDGVSEIASSGEVTHPTLSDSGDLVWAEDFRVLKMASPGSRSPTTIARPQGATAVFSPVFTSPSELIAVVQEAVEGDSGEDDALNNLFLYDIGSGIWARLTAFQGTAENWSVLRTPVVAQDGSVFFVRIRGVASETRPPSFELWSLRGETASKLRDLREEMFLAGGDDRGLLWNIYDGAEWRLFRETGTGLVDLGCGAVMVDPRALPDPDIPRESPALERRGSFERTTAPERSASFADAEMAILVGDFSSRQGAQAVVANLGLSGLEMVTHGLAPFAIAPGKWGVARRLPADADLTLAVEEFRRSFPQFADRAWIVSLSGGAS